MLPWVGILCRALGERGGGAPAMNRHKVALLRLIVTNSELRLDWGVPKSASIRADNRCTRVQFFASRDPPYVHNRHSSVQKRTRLGGGT